MLSAGRRENRHDAFLPMDALDFHQWSSSVHPTQSVFDIADDLVVQIASVFLISCFALC